MMMVFATICAAASPEKRGLSVSALLRSLALDNPRRLGVEQPNFDTFAGMKPVCFLLASVLLLSRPILAQTTPTTYEFLTLAARESSVGTLSQITFAPTFQGKTQLQLEELPASFAKSVPAHQRNLVTINQQLESLTAAGWELVQAFGPESQGREYLFRRRKP